MSKSISNREQRMQSLNSQIENRSHQPARSDDLDTASDQFERAMADDAQRKSQDQKRSDKSSGSENHETETKHDKKPNQEKSQRHQQDGQSSEIVTNGDALLASLFPQSTDSVDQAASPEAQNVDSSAKLNEIEHTVANRILVSAEPGESQEVRIILKQSVLQQTEVRITRTGFDVNVQFVTGSEEAKALLTANLTSLENKLSDRFQDQKISVAVTDPSDHSGEQHQGRSRQSRGVIDEWNPDD